MTPAQILDLARGILGLLLDVLPVTMLRQLLDEEAIKRQNAIADVAEAAKFGPER